MLGFETQRPVVIFGYVTIEGPEKNHRNHTFSISGVELKAAVRRSELNGLQLCGMRLEIENRTCTSEHGETSPALLGDRFLAAPLHVGSIVSQSTDMQFAQRCWEKFVGTRQEYDDRQRIDYGQPMHLTGKIVS